MSSISAWVPSRGTGCPKHNHIGTNLVTFWTGQFIKVLFEPGRRIHFLIHLQSKIWLTHGSLCNPLAIYPLILMPSAARAFKNWFAGCIVEMLFVIRHCIKVEGSAFRPFIKFLGPEAGEIFEFCGKVCCIFCSEGQTVLLPRPIELLK